MAAENGNAVKPQKYRRFVPPVKGTFGDRLTRQQGTRGDIDSRPVGDMARQHHMAVKSRAITTP